MLLVKIAKIETKISKLESLDLQTSSTIVEVKNDWDNNKVSKSNLFLC